MHNLVDIAKGDISEKSHEVEVKLNEFYSYLHSKYGISVVVQGEIGDQAIAVNRAFDGLRQKLYKLVEGQQPKR